MAEKKSKHQLLKSLLTPLLQEWDYDTVRQCLRDIYAEQAEDSGLNVTNERKPAKEHRRPSALELVERLDVATDRKEMISVLATRFDAKTFLPAASDVRHFLEMRGKDSSYIKQRQESFRKVLDVLLSVPADELELLHGSVTYAGPTRLGPLSDAIKATSAAVRTAGVQQELVAKEEPASDLDKP